MPAEEKVVSHTARPVVAVALATASVVVLAVSAWAAFAKMPIKLDEKGHVRQIELFADGKMELARAPGDPHPANAMLPGYHAAASAYALIVGTNLPALRSFNLLLLMLFGRLFYRHLRTAGQDRLSAVETTAIICLFPPLFAIANLVYTDVLALIFALLAVIQCRQSRHRTAAAMVCLGLLVRQNLVVLGGILFLIALWREHKRDPRPALRILADSAWPYLVPCIFFVVFFVSNEFRVGLDRPSAQPTTLSVGNVLFSFFCLSIWLWPLFIDWLPRGYRRLRQLPVYVPVLLLLAGAALAVFYRPSHEWNYLSFMVRNVPLYHLTHGVPGRAVFVLITVISLVAIAGIDFKTPHDRALTLATWFLLLIPAVLVEPRYYVPIFAILLALRIPRERWQLRALAWGWTLLLAAAAQYLQATSDKLL